MSQNEITLPPSGGDAAETVVASEQAAAREPIATSEPAPSEAKPDVAPASAPVLEAATAPAAEPPPPSAFAAKPAGAIAAALRHAESHVRPYAKPAAAAAAILVALGLGYATGASRSGHGQSEIAAQRLSEAAAEFRSHGEDLARVAGEVKAVKVAMEALRDRARTDPAAGKAQVQAVDRLA
ncbi:MAG: hypothetical protein JO048_06635, partial [Methylobacteriaceae bacterium]|nr:hypothetical protein [Methylobacteriaceae bacterium]